MRGTRAEANFPLRVEVHQRDLAKWEAKVGYQLEKILRLQQGGTGMYTPISESSMAWTAPQIS